MIVLAYYIVPIVTVYPFIYEHVAHFCSKF